MTAIATAPNHQPTGAGVLAVLMSLISQNVGATFAKHLFPLVGAGGVTFLRIGLAACLLLALRRPWRSGFSHNHVRSLVIYGAVLGAMNILIYQAFARIPIGIAVAIEVTGPLAIVLLGSRRPRDFLWLASAVGGLVMLLPLNSKTALDPLGIAFACGAAICWALYIVFGKRLSADLGANAVTWGMVIAAVLTVPIGAANAGAALLAPETLLVGLGVAALSSALPYSLEMAAMRRLPAHVFSILLSAAPAVAALAGFIVLGERLLPLQWLGIGCIVFASAGSAGASVISDKVNTEAADS